MGLKDTHVLVTGGAGHIGRTVVSAFLASGAKVSSLDIAYLHDKSPMPNQNLLEIYADTSSEASLKSAWQHSVTKFGTVETCVALAALDFGVLEYHETAADMSIDQFWRTLEVNVLGTFAVARKWLRGLKMHKSAENPEQLRNVSLIIIGSESSHWGWDNV